MPVRAVAFDLDDTLVDHEGAARTAICTWLARRQYAEVDARSPVADAWIALEKRHFGDYLSGRVDFAEHRRRRLRGLLEHVGADTTVARSDVDADLLFVEYRDIYADSWVLYDDALPALQRVAGLGLLVAVLTNGQPGQQHQKVERTGLAPHVDLLLTVGDVAAPKPDARAFWTLCERLGAAASEVVFVGDDLAVDVEGAISAGLQAVHLDRDRVTATSPRYRTIRTLDELVCSSAMSDG